MVLIDKHPYTSREEERLKEDRERTRYWKRWGPYVAERQWATGKWFFFSPAHHSLLFAFFSFFFFEGT
jgi:hypothetical protein